MGTNEFAYADVSQRGPILSATEQGPAPQHTVHFYLQDQALVESLSKFVGTALGGGGAAIVLATAAHCDALLAQLKSRGLDPSKAIHENRFILRDACDMLSQIMVNGLPDAARFTELVSGLIMRAKNAAGGEVSELAIVGELVAVLCADGNAQAAIRLEQLWNEAAKSHHFSLRCGYPITGFYRKEHSDAFLEICAEHSAVIPGEPYTDLKTEEKRLENIAHLQHKAHALEYEVALLQSEVRFRLLVEAVRDYAIFILDPEGRVLTWNAGAQRIKGYAASEIIGQHFSRFYPEEDVRARKPQWELEVAAREGCLEDGFSLIRIPSRNAHVVCLNSI